MNNPPKPARPKRARPKRARRDADDDTPRMFKRAMAMRERAEQRRPAAAAAGKPKSAIPSKQAAAAPTAGAAGTAESSNLQIKRGESLSAFGRRVDAAIPLPRARGGDSRKEQRNAKKSRTKADNLRSEYHQRWEAQRRKQEEADADNIDVSDDGEDVWAAVNARARKPKFNEVADRPPELPRAKTASSVPKSAGSLARREILEQERQRVIELLKRRRDEMG